jgi:PAS domain S-box-containing protein
LAWTALPDGTVDSLNQRWYDYTGRGRDEAPGRAWHAAIHQDDLAPVLDRWLSSVASGEPGEVEGRLRRFDGALRWFLLRWSPFAHVPGRAPAWCGLAIDLDDRKREEEALRSRERHYRSIADSIPALIAFMTPGGELDSVNRQVLEYAGATLAELQHWRTTDLVHPDDLPAVAAAWRRSVETEERYDIEHRIRRADGGYRWFHVRGLPLRDGAGRLARWYVLGTDIDDRKRAEALLAGEKRILELVAGGHPMQEILDALCRLVEQSAGGCTCSVVLLDPGGTRLARGAAPSLPPSFIDAIIGRPVTVDAGPSAMAVALNEPVAAVDLRSETRWVASGWCPMALAHGLRACWATPIASAAGTVVGAFALYYDTPTAPLPRHLGLVEQFTHIATIAIDRAQHDAALKSSEARKTAILDSALDCIVTMDHEGRITEFNPAAEHTFRYQRDEVVGKMLAEVIVPPSLRNAHQRGMARYLATGEERVLGRRVEMTAVRADGREFPVELAITRIPSDGPPSFTGYLRDITARKQAEAELRRSEAFLAEGQRLSMTGSFAWRLDTDEITFSDELRRIFAFDDHAPVTLERIGSRVHPDDLPLVTEKIALARAGGVDHDYEVRLRMPDGSVKYLRTYAHPTRYPDGHVEFVGAMQDVTQRRRSEEALDKARSELAHVARLTTLGALTASIAHEVNQPLSGIITNASTCLRMLDADPPNVDGARETAQRTIRDGNRASDVIARLRVLFAKKSAATEAVDLNDATREVIELSLSELRSDGVTVRAELADDLPPVNGDRVQLQQVILNLVRNAADAMSGPDENPKRLVIRTERDPGDRVRLTVQDTGVGLEPAVVDRLFDAFYTTKTTGMGIGLSVSRSIIEHHQGRLWAEENDGPGASFSFSLPQGTP